jgi:hypothetical protein
MLKRVVIPTHSTAFGILFMISEVGIDSAQADARSGSNIDTLSHQYC